MGVPLSLLREIIVCMNADAALLGFLPSTNIDRSHSFFVDQLELRLVERTAHALVLDSAGTELRVVPVQALTPHPFTVLGWSVSDLAGEVARLSGRGVEFMVYDGLDQDSAGVWTAPDGTGVAWFKDPDGNLLSLHSAA